MWDWTLDFWQVEFFISAALSFAITFLFYKTKDGMLRKLMIGLFALLGIFLATIGGSGFLTTSGLTLILDKIGFFWGLVMMVGMSILFVYLFKNYYKG